MSNPTNSKTEAFKMDGYIYVHRAMRKNIADLEATSTRMTRFTDEDALRLQRFFRFFWDMAEIHHTEEDDNLFPDITARDKTFEPSMAVLTQDHRELHELIEKVGAILNTILTVKDAAAREATPRELGEVITEFRRLLDSHLDREEAVVRESVGTHFSLKEQKAMEQKTMKSIPLKHMSLLVPWVGSGLPPEEVPAALKTLPLPLRIMYNISWKKKYEKFSEVLKG